MKNILPALILIVLAIVLLPILLSILKLTKDIFWSFTNMVETGEDPVFIFSELLTEKEDEKNAST